MNKQSVGFLAAVVTIGLFPLVLQADLLKDNDMKEGVSVWKGDGQAAFLNPDGTEGAEGDKGVIQVVKMPLSKSTPRYIYQDYDAPPDLGSLNVSVEVYASADFKRSSFASDYSQDIHWKPGGTWYWVAEAVPNVDFWIRGSPGYQYKLASLKPGAWVTVKAKWDPGAPATDRSICFFVPPGEGTIYIRKATASK
jgi:hypothetical protein